LNGTPILQHVVNTVAWRGPTMLVTAPGFERPPGADLYDREVVDPISDEGPLRGLSTALQHLNTLCVVVMPLDMPALGHHALVWVAEQLLVRIDAALLMTRRIGFDNGTDGPRIEPFPIALRAAAIEIVRRRLDEGRRSVHGLADEPGAVVLDAPAAWPETVWTNLNRPADVNRFLASFSGTIQPAERPDR
jgi:molybdopterin-guanine dinucleotide biosynthesis protein A